MDYGTHLITIPYQLTESLTSLECSIAPSCDFYRIVQQFEALLCAPAFLMPSKLGSAPSEEKSQLLAAGLTNEKLLQWGKGEGGKFSCPNEVHPQNPHGKW